MNEQTKNRALQMLDKRDYARKELIGKLVQKGETPEDAQAVVDRFVELGVVDDEKYGAMVVRHYAAKGYGAARIRTELSRRGVPRELWEELLSQMPPAEEAAERFIQSKCKGKQLDREMLRKLSAALQRRGFSWQDIGPVLRRLEDEIQE